MIAENAGFRNGMVGDLRIYPEQNIAASKIIDIFNEWSGPPLLITQPQQGKTGVAIAVADKLAKACCAENKKFAFYYLINTGDNDLKKQTARRLIKAGYGPNSKSIFIDHQNNFHKMKIDPSVDTTFIVVDECHISLGYKRPFNDLLDKMGVRYGYSTNFWKGAQKKIFILSLSATPFAHIVVNKARAGSFKTVVLGCSPDYLSLEDLYNKGRIKQSEELHDSINVTQFLRDRVEEFYNTYRNTKDTKHLIIRSIQKGPRIISEYIKKQYPGIFTVATVDMNSKEPSIDGLNDYLSYNQYESPLRITIIRSALRMGKTLDTVKHIGMWIDSPESQEDTMIQSVGRLVGYPDPDGYPSRKLATFPIYANVRHIELSINFYKNFHKNIYDTVPCGVQNSRSEQKRKYEIRNHFASQKEAEDYAGTRLRCSVVSDREDNVIGDIIRGVFRGTSPLPGQIGEGYLVYADGFQAAKKQACLRNGGKLWLRNLEKSYKELPKELHGRYIYLYPTEIITKPEIKKGCMFRIVGNKLNIQI